MAGLDATLRRHLDIAALLSFLKSRCRHWAIIGGAPRQWALADFAEPNDLDIVVNTSPNALKILMDDWINNCREPLQISETGFGGVRVISANWTVDIWSVERTVGLAKGLVKDTKPFRAVSRSAALSFDSIVFTSNGTVYETGFFKTLRTGVLSLNHCSISRPEKVAQKAVRLCERFRLIPDISVQAHIIRHLGRHTVAQLLERRGFAHSDAKNLTTP